MRSTLPVDDIELAYEVHDERGGAPLVLLHGMTGCGADWVHAGRDRLAGRRLVVVDARGHGRSTGWDRPITHRRCALDLLALLDHLGVDRCQAIGVSMGGNTLLHAATIAPARFEAMVTASATTSFPTQARAIMRQVPDEPPAAEWPRLRAAHVHGDDQARAIWRLPRAHAELDDDLAFTPADLARITARVLVVQGDRDPLYPVEMSVAMYRAIPAASLWVVPGGGHSPVFAERAARFAEVCVAFLDGASPG